MTSADHNPILVALDTTDVKRATELRRKLQGSVGGFKIGKEFFTANGPADVRHVLGTAPLFLDLKFHDIPNTVAGAMRAAAVLKPLIVNVHASGGPAMLRAAKQAAREEAANLGIAPPLVIAVTVLTSLDDDDLRAVGLDPPVAGQVERLAKLTA
ncbi:MAG: orotidine 5'-phosphate decarboxylase / HUMPS family protein, partial [Kiloniellales bacterium]|nr:orotidine 5'-phosphate decarboxylase / HUMPS family protein [Kiloniellales bacterium]